jgi:hypothetical protein
MLKLGTATYPHIEFRQADAEDLPSPLRRSTPLSATSVLITFPDLSARWPSSSPS